MAFLRATRGFHAGCTCDLDAGSLVLGRNPKRCGLVLDHFAVSREHARIEVVEGVAYIEDLQSRNGVLVNGRSIPPGAEGRQRLFPGDRIEIATFEFVYEEDPSSAVTLTDIEEGRPDILSSVDVASETSISVLDERASGKLQTILRIIAELSSALELERVLPNIIESLFRTFPQAHHGVILLADPGTKELVPAAFRRRGGGNGPIRVSRTLVREVLETKRAVLSADATRDLRFDGSSSVRAMHLRSVMSAPLMDRRGDVLGLMQLEVAGGCQEFTYDDLELLAGVAQHLAVVIENSRLHEAAMRAQRSELEQRFRGLIEGSIQGILIHRHFKPLFVNEAWARLHGYAVEEVMRMETVLPLIAPDHREQAIGSAQAMLRGETLAGRYETRGIRKDGQAIWLEKFTTLVDWEGGPAIQSAVIDVSDRHRVEEELRFARDELEKRVAERTAELAEANRRLEAEIAERKCKEEQLRDSEALYHSLVDHIPLCVARKNLRGEFTFVNQALAQLFGKTPQELIGKTDFDLFSREQAEQYRRDDEEVVRSGALKEVFEAVPLPDGRTLQIHTLKTGIYDAEHRIIGTQLAFWDITKHRQTEAERDRYARELERSNRDLEQFAYSVSHDLQSPLRTVATYCQLLQKQCAGQLGHEPNEFLAGAIDGTRRMRRLLDDLLTYSRVSTTPRRFEPCDAHAVLREALHNLQAAVDESGAAITSDQLPQVVCDATQLMQVFQNLIDNAIRYRGREAPRIHVSAQERPDAWQFSVRDNGVGIDRRHLEDIFLIFHRLHTEQEIPGTGVGLAVCKRIVERHGGRMWVDSDPGKGSTFHFTLAKSAG